MSFQFTRSRRHPFLNSLLSIAVLVACLPAPERAPVVAPALQSVAGETQKTEPPKQSASGDAAATERARAAYGQLPLSFEANVGQTDGQVKFISRGSGYTMFLTPTEAVLALRSPKSKVQSPKLESRTPDSRLQTPDSSAVLRMKLVGANPAPEVSGDDELPGKSNYFIGNDPAQWRTNVPHYARVQYSEVYPGTELIYYGNQGQLEYDFRLAPGADPRAIRLAFAGAEGMRVDESGELILQVAGGEVRQHKPVVYQETDGARQEIAGRYVIQSEHEIGFEVGEYDPSKLLVIDPILSYSTYLGGSGSEFGRGIAVDSLGNAYVIGETSSTNFPTANALQANSGGGTDAFVTKLNSTGTTLIYSTYLGGSSNENGNGIAVDSSGNAYVTGETSSTNFPTVNPVQANVSGRDAFVTKLNTAGNALIYSTYLGGSSDDQGFGVAVDFDGNAYVAGETSSTNFPTANPLQSNNGGIEDAFVTKLNSTGATLLYSTYLGGGGIDRGFGIAVDFDGNAYVTGSVRSTNFPTANALQPSSGGGFDDAFVTKLNSTGSTLLYSTYLGGSGGEGSGSIAVDSDGNAYVAGETSSTNFPTANPLQPANNGGITDAFVTKFNSTGSTLLYSTYLGGSGFEVGGDIAVDSSGNAYVIGETTSVNFPTANALQSANNGGTDAFATKLNAAGTSLAYSTYLGGGGGDFGFGIAVDSSGNAYVTGYTNSTNFPTANPFQLSNNGGNDAFIAKIFSGADLALTMTDSPDPVTEGGNVTYTLNVTNNGPDAATNVGVFDNLPDGVTFVSATPTQGTCGFNPEANGVQCNLGSLNNGASAAISIVVTTTQDGTLNNFASVGADESDSNFDNNSASTTTTVNAAGLEISMTDSPDPVTTGQNVTYTVTVNNDGPPTATNVTLTDTLPANATFVSANSTQGACSNSGNTVTCNLGSLNAGGTAIVTIVVTAPNTPARITNTASVTSPEADPNPADNTATAITLVLRPGSLAVTDLSNQTPNDLAAAIVGQGVTVSNVTYRGVNSSAGTFTGGANIIGFESGILLSSGRVQNAIGPNIDDGITAVNELAGDSDLSTLAGVPTNDATVLEFDFVPTNNVISFQYVFTSDEYNEFANENVNDVFGFFLNGSNVALLPGTNTAVSINTVNGGNPFGTNAQNPQFYVNNDNDDGGGLINTEMDGLTTVLSVQANVTPGQVNHIKLAIADGGDSSLDSNVFIRAGSFSDQPAEADLALSLTDSPDPVAVGSNLTYTATVINNGPVTATGVTLTDTLPSGVTFVSATPSQGTCNRDGNTVTCALGTLDSNSPLGNDPGTLGGNAVSATVNIIVTPTAAGTLNNTASVTATETDPNTANNTATATTTVTASNNLTVTNTNDSGAGSLRQAIIDANAATGTQTIAFNIPAAGPSPDPNAPRTITPASALPTITDPVVIDGATQPGFNGTPLIELNGASAGTSANGIRIIAGNSTVRGLAINRFSFSAILMETGGSNVIEANFVGTDPTGTIARGNNGVAVFALNSANNRIGGTSPAQRNLISGNNFNPIGLSQSGSTGNAVQGNFIGTDVTGTVALGNALNVAMDRGASNNVIGGTAPGAGNLISGNRSDGVSIFINATNNRVQGNLIGTNAAGTAALGNGSSGVTISDTSTNNIIGGTENGAGNVIAFNVGAGVRVSSGTGNAILSNAIFSNGGLGIDLGPNGVTPNDTGDADTGANNLQNFPIITSAVNANGSTAITGTLNSTPNTTFNLQFFANAACDSSGNGEGQFMRGGTSVTTDANGNASFSAGITGTLGDFITATATDPAGNSSEFSACRLVVAQTDVAVTTTDAPDPATLGENVTYTSTVTNRGPNPATGVQLISSLPAGAAFVSASANCTRSGSTVTCLIGGLAVGASASVSVVVRPTFAGVFANTVRIVFNENDANPNDNFETETTTVNPVTVGPNENLNFESGDFRGWNVVNNCGTGSWNIYSGTTSPISNQVIAAPPEGTFAATTDQTGGGTHLLYRDFTLAAGQTHTLSFNLYYRNRAQAFTTPDTLNCQGQANQQYRVDILNPNAPVDSIAAGDVLATVFRTNVGDPLTLDPTGFNFDLTPFAGRTVRVRFAEVDNQLFFQASVDDVRLTSAGTPTFTISGRVTNAQGGGLAGVSVALSGGATATTTTDSDGNYSFANLTAGGNYTVTPALAGFTFAPPSSTFNNLQANQTANFTGTSSAAPSADLSITKVDTPDPVTVGSNLTYTITVTNNGPNAATNIVVTDTPPANVTLVSFTSSQGSGCAPSGSNIVCNLGTLNSGATATATAVVTPNQAGTITNTVSVAASESDPNPANNSATQSTVVMAAATFTISGRVADASNNGIGDVTLTLTPAGGGQSVTATTDTNGNYSFTNVAGGVSYTLTPSRGGFTFSPPSATFNNLSQNQTANFTGTASSSQIVNNYAINQTTGATIVPGETDIGNHCDDCFTRVTLPFPYTLYDRTFTEATITSNGIIEFTGQTARFTNGCLPDADPNLNYTILGYFDDLRTDAANIPGLGRSGIFTSVSGTAPNRIFNVEWRSTFFNAGNQFINFEIRLYEGQARFDVIYGQIDQFGRNATIGVQRTATTGFTQYSCNQGGLTPGLQLSFLGSDQLFLSGIITTANGAGIPGVTVTLSGTQTASVVTDASGFYTFNNLTPGGIYTITPTREGFTFTPPNAGFENLRNSQTANFTGTQQQQTGFMISGRVANTLGEGLAGVAVALSGTQTGATTTDANGNYSFANLAASGNYTVTPARMNFTFTPPSRTFNNLSGNQTADFTGTLTLFTPVGANVTVEFDGDTINYSQVTVAGVTTANPINPATAGTLPAGYTLLQAPGIDLATTATVNGIITVCFVDAEGAISNEVFPNLRLLHGEGGMLVDRTSLVDVASRRICAQVASLSPFVLAVAPARTISGRITDGTNGLSGVTLTVTNEDTGQTLTTTTDQNGNYSFTVAAGGDYTVTTTREGTVFDPAFRTFLDLSGNQTGDFVGMTALTITGQIPGLPAGQTAIVTLSGTRSDVTMTDSNGNFTFNNLPPGGNYIVMPESRTQTFNPSRFEFTSLGTNARADFAPTANPSPTPPPPISDDFGDNVRDPAVFNEGTLTQPPGSTDPLVTVVQQTIGGDGKLVITPRSSITDASFNGYVTVRAVDFTGATAMVQVDETADGGAQTIFSIGSDDQNFFRFVAQDPEANLETAAQSRAVGRLNVRPLGTALRQLVFQARQGGVLTATPIPYDPVAMKFWRFRHDTSAAPALMHFETSPNAEGPYTIRFSRIVPGEIGALATELVAGTAGAVQTPGRAVFDNLLVQPRGIVGGFRFGTPTYTVNEGDGSVTITVMRSGAVAQSGAVTLATAAFDGERCDRVDGIARPRCDVATTLVRLRFGPGETSQNITLFITDDSYAEGTERIELGLADASGNLGLDDPLATITIIDNDTVTGPNPINTIPFFVRQQYRDFLFREPEPGGFEAWTNLLMNCPFEGDFGPGKTGSDPTCDRITVSSSFYRSPEFLARGYFIYRFYDAALGRRPTYAEFLVEMNRLAGPRTLGQQETDKRDFVTEFLQESEFTTRYGAFNTAAAVDRLLQTAGVTLPNRNQLVADLEAGRQTPAQTLRLIIESDAVSQRFFNRGFVTMQYFGYLQRDPDEAGFARWVAILDQTGDFRVMVFGFLYSPEYLMRFGPVQ